MPAIRDFSRHSVPSGRGLGVAPAMTPSDCVALRSLDDLRPKGGCRRSMGGSRGPAAAVMDGCAGRGDESLCLLDGVGIDIGGVSLTGT